VTRKPEFTVLAMELFEGRNRQIRKMCEQLSLHIITLKRISIGEVKLGNLAIGEWRHLTRAQVESLKK
jgi:pseudouridine synthase